MSCAMKTAMILQLLMLFSLVVARSDGATQDFNISFSSISAISGPPFQLQSYGGMQTLVAFRSNSTSAAAKLLFIPSSSSSSFVLAAYLSTPSAPDYGAILWIANRDHPVSGDFSLSLNQTSGTLVLLDGDGTLAWSSNNSVPVGGGPVSMDLKTDLSGPIPIGTLFLYNARNDTLWQSSDYPTNTLVSSQSLEPGMRLVSWMSSSDPSSGRYSLVMEASGLALYFNGSSVPYWAWSFYGHNDSFGVTHTCHNLIRAYMDPGGLQLQNTSELAGPEFNKCALDNPPTVQELLFDEYSTSTSSSKMTFLQVVSNGSLMARTLGAGRWRTVFDLFGKNECLIPNYCGPYGICTAPSNCSCPSSSDGSFPPTFPSNKERGCPPTRPLQCNSGSNLEFLSFTGVDYFANKDSSSLMPNFTTEDDCKNACLDDCSCLAAFWHVDSCFYATDMSGLQMTSSSSYMAFIKVEKRPQSNTRLVVGLISGVAGSLIMLMLAGAFVYWRKQKAKPLQAEDDDPFLQPIPGVARRYSYKDVETITNGFSEEIGKGGFGVVYAGALQDGTKAAVKRLDSLKQGGREFRAEVIILGGIHHNNLVGLIGFCAEGSHRLLVYEYMANSSLDKWLLPRGKLPLEWKHRFNIALGAARGLAYLHGECKNTILHLDIKPENILLDENFVAKVSDFGVSTLMGREQTHVITAMRGTPGYLAPEWLAEGFEVSEKCDVFSFGKVLLEILSARRNLDPSSQEPDKVYFPSWLYHMRQQGQGIDIADIAKVETPEEMRQATVLMNTAFLCVLENPAQRPSMERVVRMLEGHVPNLEKLDVSDIFQGLQFALKMPLPGLACSRIEEALVALYGTQSLESSTSGVCGGMSLVSTTFGDITGR